MPKFLVDENLSRTLAEFLLALGYETRHVRDVGLKGYPDSEIVAWARKNDRVIVTRDLGFGLTYSQSANPPGIILLRSKIDTVETFQDILRRLHAEKILSNPKIYRSLVIATLAKTRIVNLNIA